MQQNLPPVPLLREYVHVGRAPQAKQGNKSAAMSAILAFAVPVAIGMAMTFTFKSRLFFLAFFLLGIVLSSAIYFVRTKVPSLSAGSGAEGEIMRAYQPVLSRVASHGFDSAAEAARAIIKSALALQQSQPHVFGIVDEALKFLTERLLAIGETKKIVGDERELKRRAERLQDLSKAQLTDGGSTQKSEGLQAELTDIEQRLERVEALNQSALRITTDLLKLRSDCENALVSKVVGQAEEQKAALLLREKLEREKRVAAELAQLGL